MYGSLITFGLLDHSGSLLYIGLLTLHDSLNINGFLLITGPLEFIWIALML